MGITCHVRLQRTDSVHGQPKIDLIDLSRGAAESAEPLRAALRDCGESSRAVYSP